ncbi:MAG: SH3 domain-containing protein [Pseudomonadota bacterium]
MTLTKSVLVLVLGTAASTLVSTQAFAGSCGGTVRGLSAIYNQAKGSGFLTLRSGPRSSSRKKGELFNGDYVDVFARRGNWLEVNYNGVEGWVFRKYVRHNCSAGDLN